jgi:hypothetical protein
MMAPVTTDVPDVYEECDHNVMRSALPHVCRAPSRPEEMSADKNAKNAEECFGFAVRDVSVPTRKVMIGTGSPPRVPREAVTQQRRFTPAIRGGGLNDGAGYGHPHLRGSRFRRRYRRITGLISKPSVALKVAPHRAERKPVGLSALLTPPGRAARSPVIT